MSGMRSAPTRATRLEAILALAGRLEQSLPNRTRGAARKMTASLIAVADQVGDGLVPVDSTRLAGVPLQTVPGTHLSIIRNLTTESRRVPPAVPLIVEQLGGRYRQGKKRG